MLPAIMPFVIAYGLCRWLYPVIEKVYKKTKIPVGCIAVAVMLLAGIIVFSGIFFFGKYLLDQIRMLFENADALIMAASEIYGRLCRFFSRLFGCDTSMIYQWFEEFAAKINDGMHLRMADFLTQKGFPLLKNIMVFLAVILISLIAAVLLIKNKKQIDNQISKSAFSMEVSEISEKVWHVAGCFLKSQVIIILVVSAICSTGLVLSGNKYGLVIGIMTGILDALPVIGSGTVLIPWVLVSFLTGAYKKGIILLIICGLCVCAREILEAKLMGNSLGINEFYMLMATFAGIGLFGIPGIILGPAGVILVIEILKQI